MSDERPDYGMPVHPVCDLLPLMQGDDFRGLCGDIRTNGLVHPIVVHDGQILDGRNRVLACRDVGVQPRFVQWRTIYTGPMTVARWIWSENVERRHLTLDQILAFEVTLEVWEEKEAARQRLADGQKRGGETGGKGRPKPDSSAMNSSQSYEMLAAPQSAKPAPTLPPPSPAKTEDAPKPKRAPDVRATLAKNTGASEYKVQQALNVLKGDPDLLKQVAQGTTTLLEAEKQAKAKAPEAALPANPFNIEKAIRKVTRALSAAIKGSSDADRGVVLSELIKTLRAMR